MGDDEDRANDHEATGDEWETITWNRWFELRAADGYGIWRRGAELDAEPIVRFNADEAGFEGAEHGCGVEHESFGCSFNCHCC